MVQTQSPAAAPASAASRRHPTLSDFLRSKSALLKNGPVALIFAEDEVELESTLRHHLDCGFETLVVFLPDCFQLPADLEEGVEAVTFDCSDPAETRRALNRVIAAAEPGCWLYYCYNAEYLFFPFCETRSVREMLTFHSEERRVAMQTYVVDLYADDLQRFPGAVSLETACLDRSGYYAQARPDPVTGHPRTRQLDFVGGLRWRFEEHIPRASRRIGRISLFQARPDLTLGDDDLFNIDEYNTYACEWHHNLTAAICSFRTAKALRRNPGSAQAIDSFSWHNSTRFQWHSGQLMDLGLMEPGQWF